MTGRPLRAATAGLAARCAPLFIALVASLTGTGARADEAEAEALWRRLADGGHVLLIRHASTEAGTGDPPGFDVDDCRTQRNLSAHGRTEAQRLGAAFRARRVPVGDVRSSPWCRCLDTARLAFGHATPWAALASLFHDGRRADAQRREIIAYSAGAAPGSNLVLVTHAFNIRDLAGVSPAPGEVVVTRLLGGRLERVGRLRGPSAEPVP